MLEYTLKQLVDRQKVSIANYSSVSVFAKKVVSKLLNTDLDLDKIMPAPSSLAQVADQVRDAAKSKDLAQIREAAIVKLMQSSFPLQAA